MKKSESKYFNTARLMDKALLLLLQKKDYDYITVKEICEKAGVNRSTFYLHYETMDDLLKESLSFIYADFTDKYDDDKFTHNKIQGSPLNDLFLITPEYIMPYLEFLIGNKKLFMIAMDKPNIFQVGTYFDNIYEKIFEPILERFHVEEQERKYVLAFYISGMHAIIIEWIKGGCMQNAQYIADLLVKYTNPCVDWREA